MLQRYPAVILFCLLLFVPMPLLAHRGDAKRFKERYRVSSDKTLRVNIEIDAAEVRISKSPRDREARVIMFYDEEEFEAYADFDEGRAKLDIEFDKKGWIDSDNGHNKAEVIIELPPGVEIDLEAKIKAGEVEIDLGGLRLVGLELTTWAGEVTVEFSEPNKSEIDYLKINTKIGETDILKLGNARFREAEINGGIGEMRIDFHGELLARAAGKIDLDIGETTLFLPEDVGVKLSVSKFLFMSDIDLPHSFRKSADTTTAGTLMMRPGSSS